MARRTLYTLIEIIMALAIFVMAATAIAAAASGGVRIFARARQYSVRQADLLLAVERFERDLRNTFVYTGLGFEGESTEVTFPAIVWREGNDRQRAPAPGLVTYKVDPLKKFIQVRQDYSRAMASQTATDRVAPDQIVLAEEVESLTLAYCEYNPLDKTYTWRTSWNPEKGLPLAVRLEVVPSVSDQRRTFRRTVFIPVAHEN